LLIIIIIIIVLIMILFFANKNNTFGRMDERVDIWDIMAGAACGAGNVYLSEHLISPLVFTDVHVVLSFVSLYFI